MPIPQPRTEETADVFACDEILVFLMMVVISHPFEA